MAVFAFLTKKLSNIYLQMLIDMIKVLQIIYFVVSIAWIVAQSHDKDKDKDEKKDN